MIVKMRNPACERVDPFRRADPLLAVPRANAADWFSLVIGGWSQADRANTVFGESDFDSASAGGTVQAAMGRNEIKSLVAAFICSH
ncbi:hypothetical protein ACIOKD_41700 [Streptomyces sp. NPDC087844]|uniref:hypothetical protein n=1 Tax=Streptomyces sp. NPDC087844 TaxID=3365805 RepID=UPI0038235457